MSTAMLEELSHAFGFNVLKEYAKECEVDIFPYKKAYSGLDLTGGSKKAYVSIENNHFFGNGPLTRLIDEYFSCGDEETEEILLRGYISTSESSSFDSELESMLKDRLQKRNNAQCIELKPTKKSEKQFSKTLESLSKNSPNGALKLVIGAVGSGKSFFINRFYKKMQSDELKKNTLWAFINFNNVITDPTQTENWLCEEFIKSLSENNDCPDLYDLKVLEKIFSVEINKNRSVYDLLKASSDADYYKELANDLKTWKSDPQVFATAIARHLSGDCGKSLIVVFDNVDKRDKDVQLRVFEIAQWFKTMTRSLCILNLRDATYEAFKNEPPLDTFINESNFHIKAPYFHDVVKRRIELASEKLETESNAEYSCTLKNGMTVHYKTENLKEYFAAIYDFISQSNGSRLITSLSNRSIRRVLQLFSQVLKSGHIDVEKFIVTAKGGSKIGEFELLKALIRDKFKYYTGEGLIYNIYGAINNANRPSALLKLQIILYLNKNFNFTGCAGIKGYFYVETLKDIFVKQGFEINDVHNTLIDLLKSELIISDRYQPENLDDSDLIQISPAGHIHLKFLATRLEYISSCSLSARILNKDKAKTIGNIWTISGQALDISLFKKREASLLLHCALNEELIERQKQNPIFKNDSKHIEEFLTEMKSSIDWKPSASC